ncbi:Uncharacterised protein [Mycolicibacterium vanbaalenii]|uniref:Uncharacterized protein n=1 Tax=Mycolicibacterium vanbaalenii TaxID=110539 RepID=A0A5S9QWA6_MYCVN|nr:Uncharacterised protein [Mycolicibacterium vanbaalenii]
MAAIPERNLTAQSEFPSPSRALSLSVNSGIAPCTSLRKSTTACSSSLARRGVHVRGQSQLSRDRWDNRFRLSAAIFGAAVALHGADHLRRGMDVIPPAVMVAGMTQIALAVLTIMLVFLGSRWAPHAAVVVGFVSAAGFAVAHLLPTWGFFSDSFINALPAARITWFSWVTAVFEIIADIVFGLVGLAVLRSRATSQVLPAVGRD